MIPGLHAAQEAQLATLWPRVAGLAGVVAYGSRARGDHRPASDLDLALIGHGLSLKQQLALAVQVDALDLPFELDLLRWDDPSLQAAMRASIRRDGALLWGAWPPLAAPLHRPV